MDFFNIPLHSWFSLYRRDLPWRNTTDPYKIWLSEIILQQTRIDQGLAYYNRFVDEFPTISDLATAPEDKVLKLWQGLGYYSRARNLHTTAKFIVETYNGVFPNEYKNILSLKGIGEYTAAAIASISFNLEYPTVDGNVYRVLSRFFGIDDPIDTSSGKKTFANLAKELIKGTAPALHNQALMEFGALQCVPKSPDCPTCPLVENSGHLYIRKRTGNDIWKNLYEFPYIETEVKTDIEEVLNSIDFLNILPESNNIIVNKITEWKTHTLSHQKIHYRFILITSSLDFISPDNITRVNKEDIFNFAVPRLLEAFLDDYLKSRTFM